MNNLRKHIILEKLAQKKSDKPAPKEAPVKANKPSKTLVQEAAQAVQQRTVSKPSKPYNPDRGVSEAATEFARKIDRPLGYTGTIKHLRDAREEASEKRWRGFFRSSQDPKEFAKKYPALASRRNRLMKETADSIKRRKRIRSEAQGIKDTYPVYPGYRATQLKKLKDMNDAAKKQDAFRANRLEGNTRQLRSLAWRPERQGTQPTTLQRMVYEAQKK